MNSNSAVASLNFGDIPVARQVVSSYAVKQPATFTNSTVTLLPSAYESDVIPRGQADGFIGIDDWVQVGRFVAGLDVAQSGAEFQAADCSPRQGGGDGQLTIIDWLQAGRYAVGLDAPALISGPIQPSVISPTFLKSFALTPQATPSRLVRVVSTNSSPGQRLTLGIELLAQGDEAGLGFSVNFNPSQLTLLGVRPGNDVAGSYLTLNTNQPGVVGAALLLPFGTTFTAGVRQTLQLDVSVADTANGLVSVNLTDTPVVRQVTDSNPLPLSANYQNATVDVIVAKPTLNIARQGSNVTLWWPGVFSNFVLQASIGAAPSQWTSGSFTPFVVGTNLQVIFPATNLQQFYRLSR
jgi:hypothetical protein